MRLFISQQSIYRNRVQFSLKLILTFSDMNMVKRNETGKKKIREFANDRVRRGKGAIIRGEKNRISTINGDI